MSEELRVGAVREAIDGLPDDAPAFVTVGGWDLAITWTNQTQVIDPPGAERGPDGWPTRPGLEMQAGLIELDSDERDKVAAQLERSVVDLLTCVWTTAARRDDATGNPPGRIDWPERVEQARSIAVRLDAELTDLRRAIESIHTPKAIPMESTPEEPEIICSTCRTEFPCETRSFSDWLDPINALDEFSGEPEPF